MGKMKKTNEAKYRQTVLDYLCGSVYDYDEAMAANVLLSNTEEGRARYIRDRFEREHNYAENKRFYPNAQERVASWLAGLPLNIAYSYADIIELAERWHETELDEKQREMVCERWFEHLAFNLMYLWKRYNLPHVG